MVLYEPIGTLHSVGFPRQLIGVGDFHYFFPGFLVTGHWFFIPSLLDFTFPELNDRSSFPCQSDKNNRDTMSMLSTPITFITFGSGFLPRLVGLTFVLGKFTSDMSADADPDA